MTLVTRRRVLQTLAGVAAWPAISTRRALGARQPLRFADEVGPPESFRLETGLGLEARRFVDLRTLGPERLQIAPERFYVRTGVPQTWAPSPWSVEIGALGGMQTAWPMPVLRARARAMGEVLLECSGNPPTGRTSLISAAAWTGAPLEPLLEASAPRSLAPLVEIEGLDDHPVATDGSRPGASWIFSRAALAEAGAFLAVGLGGAPLRPENGGPVRLVVPGWYGCCAIKWVRRVTLVGAETPASAHMIEFASRTHQAGEPARAADFQPATVDRAALPVRAAWVGDSIALGGVQWGGGHRGRDRLVIRFGDGERYRAVDHLEAGPAASWSWWSHQWRPPGPGRYGVQLQVEDLGVRTRRLDLGFYHRTLLVD